MFELRPHHVARALTVLALIPAFYILKFEGVTTETRMDLATGETSSSSNLGTQFGRAAIWFVLGCGFAAIEWYTRTRRLGWPAPIHGALVSLRLARPISPAPSRSPGDPARTPTPRAPGTPIFDLQPYHAARIGAGLAIAMFLVDFPNIPWLIVAAVCLVVEWQTRTKHTTWPPAVRDILVPLRLAPAPGPGQPREGVEPRHPVFDLQPFHAARIAAGIAAAGFLLDFPNLAWLVLTVGALIVEWQTRTKRTTWPSAVRDILVPLRLAPGGSAPSAAGGADPLPPPMRPFRPVMPFRRLTVGDALGVTARAYRKHWKLNVVFTLLAMAVAVATLLAVGLVVWKATSATIDAGDASSWLDASSGPALLAGLTLLGPAYLLVMLVLTSPFDAATAGVTMVAADRAIRGDHVDLGSAIAIVRPRIWTLCRVWLAVVVPLLVIGMLPSLVLGATGDLDTYLAISTPISLAVLIVEIMVGVLVTLSRPAVLFENAGVVTAMRRSMKLVRPMFWRILGLHLLLFAISLAMFVALVVAVNTTLSVVSTAGDAGELLGAILAPLSYVVAMIVIYGLFTTLQTVLYIDARARTEPAYRDHLGAALTAAAAAHATARAAAAPGGIASPKVSLTKAPTAPAPVPATPVSLVKPVPVPKPKPVPATPVSLVKSGIPPARRAPAPPPESGPTEFAPATAPRSARRSLAVLGVVVALAIAGGGAWWAVDRFTSGKTSAAPATLGELRYTFPEQPSVGWTLDAGEVFAGAEFGEPVPSPMGDFRPGFVDLGDSLITVAYLPQSDQPADLVVIDSASGRIRWSKQVGFGVSCAGHTVDDLLPCYARSRSGPDYETGVTFFDMSDGSVDHRIPADNIARIEVVDGDIITAGPDRVARGTTTDLTARWTVPLDAPQETGCLGSGDSFSFGATDKFVYYGNDGGQVLLRAGDGRRLDDGKVTGVTEYPGHGLVALSCAGDDPDEQKPVVVLDESGTELRTHTATPSRTQHDRLIAAPGSPDRYLVGGVAYDFATGNEAWASSHQATGITGDTVLAVDENTLSGLDYRTGEQRWNTPIETGPSAMSGWLSDGRSVIRAAQGAIEATDLATGDTLWSTPDENADTYRGPRRAGNGIATTTDESIIFYAPTGGPVGDYPPSAAADGDTQLVTRCGRTPEMTPVEYRTDTDGLVVRMELRARCSAGDVVSTDALDVTIHDDDRTVAAGRFDFSRQPLYLPPSDDPPTEYEFKFPVGSFWRLPNSLGGNSDADARAARAGSAVQVDCIDAGTSRGPSEGRTRAAGRTATAVAAGPVPAVDTEAAALDALRAQVDADRPTVRRDLADRWLPQISSKYVGLDAVDVDGVTPVHWTAAAILKQHLQLRLQYPEVRLLWSQEWSTFGRTFNADGYWVTVAGVTFTGYEQANGWCDSRDIPTDECFAKLVSSTRGPEGTTKYR